MYCRKDCSKCKYLNERVDNNGYIWAWECLIHDVIVSPSNFGDEKYYDSNVKPLIKCSFV